MIKSQEEVEYKVLYNESDLKSKIFRKYFEVKDIFKNNLSIFLSQINTNVEELSIMRDLELFLSKLKTQQIHCDEKYISDISIGTSEFLGNNKMIIRANCDFSKKCKYQVQSSNTEFNTKTKCDYYSEERLFDDYIRNNK